MTWTPIDVSGAGLTLQVLSARCRRSATAVYVSADLLYPITLSLAAASIGGLPWMTGPGQSGLVLGYQALGFPATLLVRANQTIVLPCMAATGAVLTNLQLSGKNLVFSGVYEPRIPVVVSGQSNATALGSVLPAVHPPVTTISQGATAIAAWAEDGAQWARLEPVLAEPIEAFVWWQGESDVADLSHYEADLSDLICRVRATQAPHLPVVICGANSYPGQQPLRDIQQAYAASHDDTTYVPSDDLPADNGSQHLTAAGYQTMAERVHGVLKATERRIW